MARLIVDTGPLVAAISRADRHHAIAAAVLTAAGRDALVPQEVVVEVDMLVRRRHGPSAARAFLDAMRAGVHERGAATRQEWHDAVVLDEQFADLDLGLVDATVMSMARSRRLPVLTFDFRDFQPVPGPDGAAWTLVVEPHELE